MEYSVKVYSEIKQGQGMKYSVSVYSEIIQGQSKEYSVTVYSEIIQGQSKEYSVIVYSEIIQGRGRARNTVSQYTQRSYRIGAEQGIQCYSILKDHTWTEQVQDPARVKITDLKVEAIVHCKDCQVLEHIK
ncbi:hypothetical protein Btru_008003 [Bulinus truncatus]|nr:hypothetical protein Btru_008003 [Bulinus truncatus]